MNQHALWAWGTIAAAVILVSSWLIGCEQIQSDQPHSVAAPVDAAWFQPMQEQWGIDFHYESGATGDFLFPETVGGGAATVDLTGNGLLDLYLVQGGSVTATDDQRPPNRLYHQHTPGSFEDVTEISGAGDRGMGMGVAAGDFNNNGSLDLYVTNVGRNTLLRNRGDGAFDDVTTTSNTGDTGWGTSAAFVDMNHTGYLDLFVVNYVAWTPELERTCRVEYGRREYCTPNAYEAPQPDVLYRNNGDETFADISISAGLHSAYGNGLGVVCSDLNRSGNVDIFVANDQMPNQLWLNRGDETFEEAATRLGCAVDGRGHAKAGMGVLAVDLDNNGYEDLFVVNLTRETDSLYRNHGTHFADETMQLGISSVTRQHTRFGVGMLDFNNDGLLDLYQANGRVAQIGTAHRNDDPYAEPNVLMRGTPSGRFEHLLPLGGTIPTLYATSRAAAFGDLDNDGAIDIVVVNRDDTVHVLQNVVPDRGNWITFRVLDEHGRDALNAVVTATVDYQPVHRTVRSAYSYMAANDPRVHFGIGENTSIAHVSVRWLDGVIQHFGPFEANQIITLKRDATGTAAGQAAR